jgi:hypothetical protein
MAADLGSSGVFRGGEASRALGVEKHAVEEPSGHRFLQQVVGPPVAQGQK